MPSEAIHEEKKLGIKLSHNAKQYHITLHISIWTQDLLVLKS